MTNITYTARKIFLDANDEGPWPCYFCDNEVTSLRNRIGCVHHIDEDRTNNSPENLAASHFDCHTRHHHTNKEVSEETRKRASKSAKRRWAEGRGNPPTEESRKKIGDSLRGRPKSPEHAKKLSEVMTGKKASDETRAKLSAAARRRWSSPEEREKQRQRTLKHYESKGEVE